MIERQVDIRSAGDGALLIELGEVTPAVGAFARALAACIRAEAWPGLREVVPAYRTVLVSFDPCHPAADSYADRVGALLAQQLPEQQAAGRVVEIPVRYGGEDGPDLADVAAYTGMTVDQVVHMHASVLYTVEFLGFSPGFPYLSGLPTPLATPRLSTPRVRVMAGSIGIGGAQTGIYPLDSPGGWRLIGRTTALRFDPARPETLPYGPGDRIRFIPIELSDGSRPKNSIADEGGEPPGYEVGAQGNAAMDERAPIGDLHADMAQGRDTSNMEKAACSGTAPAGEAVTDAESDSQAAGYGLRVVRAGPLASVQDRGRFGWADLGYGSAGAMDAEAMIIGNRLLGNDPGAAVLELTFDGGEFEILHDLVIAITGADLGATLDGELLPLWHAYAARAGSRLVFTQRRLGLRAYLAVAGGIRTAVLLGSRATDLVACLGGIDGRTIRAGDLLPVAPSPTYAGRQLRGDAVPRYAQELLIRVVLGPQDHWFSSDSLRQFATGAFTVSGRSDRTGIRLNGPSLLPTVQRDLASEGQACGAIQVPPDGMPIVLTADGRGVGGYPKIATAISADLPLLGQAVPGTVVRFQPVSAAEARATARIRLDWLATLPMLPAAEPVVRCLLEGRQSPEGRWSCPRSLACLVSQRCIVPGLEITDQP